MSYSCCGIHFQICGQVQARAGICQLNGFCFTCFRAYISCCRFCLTCCTFCLNGGSHLLQKHRHVAGNCLISNVSLSIGRCRMCICFVLGLGGMSGRHINLVFWFQRMGSTLLADDGSQGWFVGFHAGLFRNEVLHGVIFTILGIILQSNDNFIVRFYLGEAVETRKIKLSGLQSYKKLTIRNTFFKHTTLQWSI